MKETDFCCIQKYFGDAFQFGVHGVNGEKSYVREVPAELGRIPYLCFRNCRGDNIFMRPLSVVSAHYMLVDDLGEVQAAEHIGKPGRLVVETSPRNYQTWIRTLNPIPDQVKKILLLQLGSDPGAAPKGRWGRSPGFTNRKLKYLGAGADEQQYPFAKLHFMDARPVEITLPTLPPDAERSAGRASSQRVSAVDEISRSDYEIGDESRTDIKYCMSLFRRGLSDVEIRARLIEERPDWGNHKGGNRLDSYLKRTIEKARLWTRGK